MKTFRFVILLVLAALCLPVTTEARRPHGTDMTGVITQVDHASRGIVFVQDDGARRELVYATRAKFWHDGQETPLTALKPGMHVRLDLHQPLIGPAFVTQIRLLEPAAARGGDTHGAERP